MSTPWVTRVRCLSASAGAALAVLLALAPDAHGQALRFGNHRTVEVPDYATIKIGPFYSTALFSQSVGYRYTRSSGTGTDFLTANDRGEIKEDGSDLPMISSLDVRNYLVISRSADLDVSFTVGYAYYPLDTQEDQFFFDIAPEGVFGSLSSSFWLSPVVRGTVYDRITYKTDYVDTRGEEDAYGGREYEYFQNVVGLNMDWLLAKDKNVGFGLSRTDHMPQSHEFENREYVSYRESLHYEQEVVAGVVMGARMGLTQTDYDHRGRADLDLIDYSWFARFGRGGTEGLDVSLTEATVLEANIGYSVAAATGEARSEDENDTTVSRSDGDQESVVGGLSLTTQLRRDLSHSLSAARRIQDGFDSASEQVDQVRYALNWGGHAARANLFSHYSDVQPSDPQLSDYSTWTTGVGASYPVNDYVTLHARSSYSIRDNEDLDSLRLEEEDRNDYETWVSRIGTSFDVTKKILFDTYVTRVERFSDSEDLEYTRDIFSARLVFRHRL